MPNIFLSKVKDLSHKKSIYLVFLLFLFLLQFFMGGNTLYPYTDSKYIAIFSLIGLLTALIRRAKSTSLRNEKLSINIVFSDYNFHSYSASSLLSLLYAILQGLFLGTGLGLVFYSVGSLFYGSLELFGINIAFSFLCIVFTILTRILIEGISLMFKLSEDISKTIDK